MVSAFRCCSGHFAYRYDICDLHVSHRSLLSRRTQQQGSSVYHQGLIKWLLAEAAVYSSHHAYLYNAYGELVKLVFSRICGVDELNVI